MSNAPTPADLGQHVNNAATRAGASRIARPALAVAILVNENRLFDEWMDDYLDEPAVDAAIDELDEFEPPLIEEVRVNALGRIGAGLLTPFISAYTSVRADNPAAAIPALDSLLVVPDAGKKMARFENSIFHIPKYMGDADRIDDEIFDTGLQLEPLFAGCAEFMSWFAPELPKNRRLALMNSLGEGGRTHAPW